MIEGFMRLDGSRRGDSGREAGRRALIARLRRALEHLARGGAEPRGAIEPGIRRVVAKSLGVGPDELTPEVSLTDELAADSLDLIELGIALEAEFGITLPEAVLDQVRTYRDLVGSVDALARERQERERAGDGIEFVRVCVVPGPGRGDGELHRACWLTPYTAEIIAEDTLRGGDGARLEMSVPANLSDAALARVQEQLAWLGDCEIGVSVRRDLHVLPGWPVVRPHAA